MESARIETEGMRIRAEGRIVSAEAEGNAAYYAEYLLEVDSEGITSSVYISVVTEYGRHSLILSRPDSGIWDMERDGIKVELPDVGGVLDVDLSGSPVFRSLAMRREELCSSVGEATARVIYVQLPSLELHIENVEYRSSDEAVHVVSPMYADTLKVDPEGFVIDAAGFVTRI